jgi:Arc-like DNA binding domain
VIVSRGRLGTIWPLTWRLLRSNFLGINETKERGQTMPERDELDFVQPKVRMREKLRARLAEAAAQRDVSLNAEIVARLERSLDQPEIDIDVGRLQTDLMFAIVTLVRLAVAAKDEESVSLAKETMHRLAGTLDRTPGQSKYSLPEMSAVLEALLVRLQESEQPK